MQTQMLGNLIVERRLRSTTRSLRLLREELRISEEHLQQIAEEAGDAEIRSLVSETPLAARDYQEVERHRVVLAAQVRNLYQQTGELERQQDALLDRLRHRG